MPCERAVERDLARGRRQQVLAAQDVGDLHQGVVDRVDQRVERVAVGAQQREVGDVLRREGDLAADQVGERDRLVRHPQPEHRRPADEVLELRLGQLAAVAVVPLHLGAAGLAARVDLLGRAVAVVRRAGLAQALGDVGVDREPVGLAVGAELAAHLRALVPVDAEPAQRAEDRVVALLGVAGEVGVLDAEHQGAAEVARERPVEQRAAHVADVDEAGRARREADPHLLGGEVAEHGVSHERPPCSSECRCRRSRSRPRRRPAWDRRPRGCR